MITDRADQPPNQHAGMAIILYMNAKPNLRVPKILTETYTVQNDESALWATQLPTRPRTEHVTEEGGKGRDSNDPRGESQDDCAQVHMSLLMGEAWRLVLW